MAVNRRIHSITFPAGSDLSSNQFRFVGLGTTDPGYVAVVASGTAGYPIGILMNKPSGTAHGAEVAVQGSEVKLEAGAAITVGDLVVAVTGGRGSPIGASGGGPAGAGTAYIVGMCTQAAAGSGAMMGVLVMPDYVAHA